MSREIFADRHEAGRLLARELLEYEGEAVIFALPRGGVETAVEVAARLKCPLGLIIARKIGHPARSEYAVGAVTEKGPAVWNPEVKSQLDKTWRRQAVQKERAEAKRRRAAYLAGRKAVDAHDKI